jgi:ADP-ribose pyrophosphatase YjhB (NUDIX family)
MKYCSSCGALVRQQIPDGDNRQRWVCGDCHTVHYQNPKLVVGCVPQRDGEILLCKRSIEPRYGYWTLPAGFMELGETIQAGAARETQEEACAEVRIGRLFASVDVIDAGQVHLFFMADLLSGHQAGAESLDTRLYAEQDIPWNSLAFRSGVFALQKYFEDAGRDRGVHHTEFRRPAPGDPEKAD